jgi:hypothetical protein
MQDIASSKVNFHSLYEILEEKEWRIFTVGLLNACSRLVNPTHLWSYLKDLGKAHGVPVLLPTTEGATLMRYARQMWLLSYRCLLTPGAIRRYIHLFEHDPRSLELLGWWLAMWIAPDEEWLSLTVGPDFKVYRSSIMDGIKAFERGIPFVNILDDSPLQSYGEVIDSTAQREIYVRKKAYRFRPGRDVPIGGCTKRHIAQCGLELQR